MPGSTGEARAALLRTVSLHGGAKALLAVQSALADADPEVQEEALGLLADWESSEAAEPLLALVRSTMNPTHRALALRGYLRMAGLAGLPPARRLEMAREGLRLAARDDERRLALAALGGVPTAEALRTALPLVEREGLTEEASAAVVAIAQRLLPAEQTAVAAAMDQVLKHVKSMELRRQATDLRARAAQAGR
jgi:hypothetical protein